MKSSEALPESVEAISAEWLSEALSSVGQPVRATSVAVLDAHSGTTGRARIGVEWDGAAQLPASLFVKLPPTDPVSRSMVVETGMGRREASFYADLACEIPVRVPTAYFAGATADGSGYVMLLEDLEASGCSFPLVTDGRAEHEAYARSLVSSLGRLHAAFWESRRFGADLSWVEPAMRSEWGRVLLKLGLEQFGAEMPDDFSELAGFFIDDMDAFNDLLDAGPHTLIHGDSHLGNLFVDAGEIGWLDWACFSHAPGMRDVAYFLTNSLDADVRRDNERDLLERYRKSLASAGGPERTREAVWRDYRRYAAYSFVSAVVTAAAGDRMQPLEVGRRAMERMTTAIIDLDTVALFREELGAR